MARRVSGETFPLLGTCLAPVTEQSVIAFGVALATRIRHGLFLAGKTISCLHAILIGAAVTRTTAGSIPLIALRLCHRFLFALPAPRVIIILPALDAFSITAILLACFTVTHAQIFTGLFLFLTTMAVLAGGHAFLITAART